MRTLAHLICGDEGSISPMMALALLPICGAVAMASEVGYWTMSNRNMQHAADSAALAAAASGDATLDSGVERYKREASAVAATYKLGADATTTTVKVDCPGSAAGAADCYRVRVARVVPFTFARLAGFTGVAAPSGGRGAPVAAVAYARQKVLSEYYCAIALGTADDALTMNGTNKVGWEDCDARSNGGGKCTSNDFRMLWAKKAKTCSNFTQTDDTFADPYASVSSKLPDKTQVPCSANINNLTWVNVSGTNYARACGAQTLTGDLNVTTPNSAVILDGGKLTTDFTSGGKKPTTTSYNVNITKGSLVYTDSNGGTLGDWFSGGGQINITAPTSGTLANLAIVDDSRRAASDYNVTNTFHLLGVIYAPKRSLDFKGSEFALVGSDICLAFVTTALYSNGGKLPNGSPTASCDALGYTLPGTPPVRQALVQ